MTHPAVPVLAELLVLPTERKELPRVLGPSPEVLVAPGLPASGLDLQLVLMHPSDAASPRQLVVPIGVGPMDAQPISLVVGVDRCAVGKLQQRTTSVIGLGLQVRGPVVEPAPEVTLHWEVQRRLVNQSTCHP